MSVWSKVTSIAIIALVSMGIAYAALYPSYESRTCYKTCTRTQCNMIGKVLMCMPVVYSCLGSQHRRCAAENKCDSWSMCL